MTLSVKLYCNTVVDKFFTKFLLTKQKIEQLIIVSPWITPIKTSHGNFSDIVNRIDKENIRTYVITREPEYEDHKNAINKLKKLKYVEIIFNEDLHAKFYICDCKLGSFAMVCSANMTQKSLSNYEIGVMIHNRGEAEPIFRQLIRLGTIDMRLMKNNIKFKKMLEVLK